jgi:hypothetical protein
VKEGCKHAAATVAAYLKSLSGEAREAVLVDDDDLRSVKKDTGLIKRSVPTAPPSPEPPPAPPLPELFPAEPLLARAPASVSWEEKIKQHIRAKSQSELADLVWSLICRFPAVRQEIRERILFPKDEAEPSATEAHDSFHDDPSST